MRLEKVRWSNFERELEMYRNCMKRFVDIVFSIFAFPALLLVLVIVGLLSTYMTVAPSSTKPLGLVGWSSVHHVQV